MSKNDNSQIVGKVLLTFDELNSTNDFALNLVSNEHPIEGTVVMTHLQTGGRGQRGNTWSSEQGQNLTISIILRPTFLIPTEQFHLNKAISIAVCQTLRAFEIPQTKIKWPNDIYINDRKVAGILIQNILKSKSIDCSIVGIGLNVNQSTFSKKLPNPTSMFLEVGRKMDLQIVLNQLMRNLDLMYKRMIASKASHSPDYHQLLYRRGVKSTFRMSDGKLRSGIIQGVNEVGKLEILFEGSYRKWFSLQEISLELP